jgi:hypothetical protein
MKTATINTCIGSQPYLYNCIVWRSGNSAILKENILFEELVDFLSSLLLSPYQPDALSPVEFASRLLDIAEEEEYSFTIPYSLVEDYDK